MFCSKLGTYVVVAFLLTLMVPDVWAQSQRPPPSGGEITKPNQGHPTKSKQRTKSKNPGAKEGAAIKKLVPKANGRSTEKQRKQRDKEPAGNWWSPIFSGVIALFSGLLFFVAYRQTTMVHTIERAYVKMSHCSPGVNFYPERNKFDLKIEIKNWGRTPATVTDILIKPIILLNGEPFSEKPDYSRSREQPPPKAFLVTQDHFYFSSEVFKIEESQINEITEGNKILVVIGYVDYTDKFNTQHRAGYARRYKPLLDTGEPGANNLIFVTQDGYNYDCLKRKCEHE